MPHSDVIPKAGLLRQTHLQTLMNAAGRLASSRATHRTANGSAHGATDRTAYSTAHRTANGSTNRATDCSADHRNVQLAVLHRYLLDEIAFKKARKDSRRRKCPGRGNFVSRRPVGSGRDERFIRRGLSLLAKALLTPGVLGFVVGSHVLGHGSVLFLL
jgi:hypothetical protein